MLKTILVIGAFVAIWAYVSADSDAMKICQVSYSYSTCVTNIQ